MVTINGSDSLQIRPETFSDSIVYQDEKTTRNRYSNTFFVSETLKDTVEIPFITSPKLIKSLLEAELEKPVGLSTVFPSETSEVLYGTATDSIVRRMLYTSDNFLAEQLMMTTASTFSDTLNFRLIKKQLLETHLNDLKQQPRWVDGSGLSRYNLFTPASLVDVLSRLWADIPKKRLFHLFPYWDADGTIPLQKEKEKTSFILGKSGSMGNIYNLCGYLRTKSGRYLAFSFMNNHYKGPSSEIRKQMFETLKAIHNSN